MSKTSCFYRCNLLVRPVLLWNQYDKVGNLMLCVILLHDDPRNSINPVQDSIMIFLSGLSYRVHIDMKLYQKACSNDTMTRRKDTLSWLKSKVYSSSWYSYLEFWSCQLQQKCAILWYCVFITPKKFSLFYEK